MHLRFYIYCRSQFAPKKLRDYTVSKESITLFGPSNPVNWKPWSDKSQIIAKQDLKNIEVSDVMSLIEEMPIQ